MNFLFAFFLIGILIFIHELGHFLAARFLKVPVSEFAVGFGPVLLEKTPHGESLLSGVRFTLRAFPLGGFVRFQAPESGTNTKVLDPFGEIPPASRLLIALSGPFFSIIAMWLFFVAALGVWGNPPTPHVDGFNSKEVSLFEPSFAVALQATSAPRGLRVGPRSSPTTDTLLSSPYATWDRLSVKEVTFSSTKATYEAVSIIGGMLVWLFGNPDIFAVSLGGPIGILETGSAIASTSTRYPKLTNLPDQLPDLRASNPSELEGFEIMLPELVPDLATKKISSYVEYDLSTMSLASAPSPEEPPTVVASAEEATTTRVPPPAYEQTESLLYTTPLSAPSGSEETEVELSPPPISWLAVADSEESFTLMPPPAPLEELIALEASGETLPSTQQLDRPTSQPSPGAWGFLKSVPSRIGDSVANLQLPTLPRPEETRGLATLMFYMGVLSVCIAFINLIPLPPFDGFHALVSAAELVIRRPISRKLRTVFGVVGVFVLLSLLVVGTKNDLFPTDFANETVEEIIVPLDFEVK